MDREALRRQLEDGARRMADRLASEASASRRDMAAMESTIDAAADRFKAEALQACVDAVAPGPEGGEEPTDSAAAGEVRTL